MQKEVKTGQRFLGGNIGSVADCQDWIEKEIENSVKVHSHVIKVADLQIKLLLLQLYSTSLLPVKF